MHYLAFKISEFLEKIENLGGWWGSCLIAVNTKLKSQELSTQITSEILSVNVLRNAKSFIIICSYYSPNLSIVEINTFYRDLSAVLMLTKIISYLGILTFQQIVYQ